MFKIQNYLGFNTHIIRNLYIGIYCQIVIITKLFKSYKCPFCENTCVFTKIFVSPFYYYNNNINKWLTFFTTFPKKDIAIV